ncbi:hypothetical protein K0M31_016908 [Melipona bicolor]|uniref:Uncharacterized protein n=1 Tax=Melipona bicolor TaxID=60889 RepID=A0AA40KEK0_9HYME|nr:hypothetical protein K0M31_016908 [Melipona bicolor]
MRQMLPRMNKILPTFRESLSDCSLMIVTYMHSMLSLQPRNNLHKKKPKVKTNMSNEDKYVKVKP